MDDLAQRAAARNTQLAVDGVCVMHNRGAAPPAEYLLELPIGNVLPLCGECCAWWRSNARKSADPAARPVGIRDYRRGEWVDV